MTFKCIFIKQVLSKVAFLISAIYQWTKQFGRLRIIIYPFFPKQSIWRIWGDSMQSLNSAWKPSNTVIIPFWNLFMGFQILILRSHSYWCISILSRKILHLYILWQVNFDTYITILKPKTMKFETFPNRLLPNHDINGKQSFGIFLIKNISKHFQNILLL